MKYIITERQYRILSEQKSDYEIDKSGNALLKNTGIRSDKDYETTKNVISNLGGSPFERYQSQLKKIPGDKMKRIALIFPEDREYEIKFLSLIKDWGVIPGFYRSLKDALVFIDVLKSKGVKAEELVIGSHGDGYNLLMTSDGNFGSAFLEDLKDLVTTNTTVFFTACYGADHLRMLKSAAERLGVGVYGAAGLYNPILNSAEKGFYFCSADKLSTKALQSGAYSNKGLLQNGYCKKVKDSPITWVNGFIQSAIRFAGFAIQSFKATPIGMISSLAYSAFKKLGVF